MPAQADVFTAESQEDTNLTAGCEDTVTQLVLRTWLGACPVDHHCEPSARLETCSVRYQEYIPGLCASTLVVLTVSIAYMYFCHCHCHRPLRHCPYALSIPDKINCRVWLT